MSSEGMAREEVEMTARSDRAGKEYRGESAMRETEENGGTEEDAGGD